MKKEIFALPESIKIKTLAVSCVDENIKTMLARYTEMAKNNHQIIRVLSFEEIELILGVNIDYLIIFCKFDTKELIKRFKLNKIVLSYQEHFDGEAYFSTFNVDFEFDSPRLEKLSFKLKNISFGDLTLKTSAFSHSQNLNLSFLGKEDIFKEIKKEIEEWKELFLPNHKHAVHL